MGRDLEFDYNEAIDSATRLFWKKGYSNTSLRELLKVMKIGEGSFYNSVKSKKNLYLECLKHYAETVGRDRQMALMSPKSVKKGVKALFRTLLDHLDDPRSMRQCLMANSISLDVLEEKGLGDFILAASAKFDVQLTDRLKIAMEAGELKDNFQAGVTAQIIVTYIQGLFRISLVSYDRKKVEHQIKVLLVGLGL